MFAWIFFTVELILRQLTDKPAYVPIIFLNVLLQPLQGFWNFFIYVRPRYIAYRQRERRQQEHQPQRQAGRWKAFVKSLPVDAEDYDEPSTEFKEERPNPQTHTEERWVGRVGANDSNNSVHDQKYIDQEETAEQYPG